MSSHKFANYFPLIQFAGVLCTYLAATLSCIAANPSTLTSERMPLSLVSLLLDIAVLENEIVVVGERGHILKSRDDGNSWRQMNAPTRETLTNVFFADEKTGWISGHSGILLKTKNGGDNWELLTDPESEISYFDSLFFDGLNGILIGGYGEFARTKDGGITLERELIDDEELHLYDIQQSPNGTLYIAGEGGQILRSDNKGKSWKKLNSPYSASFFGFLCLDDNNLLSFGLRGHLFRSSDAGRSWNQVPIDSPAMLSSGIVLSSGNILIAGISDQVFISGDQGLSFHPITIPEIDGTVAIAQSSDNRLVHLCGKHGIFTIEFSVLESSLPDTESNNE